MGEQQDTTPAPDAGTIAEPPAAAVVAEPAVVVSDTTAPIAEAAIVADGSRAETPLAESDAASAMVDAPIGQSPGKEEKEADSKRRRRRSSMKAIKYVDDDGSEEEAAVAVEKKRRARQLDSDLRTDVGYPQLEQIVGRRMNKRSGAVEYLCKFLSRSYLHLWWLTFDELELFIPLGYQKHHRVQLYERKLRREGYQELDDVDDVEANKVTVEKILSHKIDPRDHLDEQIEKRRGEMRTPVRYPRVTDYFLLDNADSLPERLTGITQKLLNENGSEIFAQPVDADEIPDYLNIISNPMDLGTIMTRLGRESYYVGPSAASLFASDVRLVFVNCKEFNTEGSDIWNLANELLKTFEKWMYDWIYCPTAWLKLPPTGNTNLDRDLGLAFRESGEDCYDLWLPWQTGCSICRSNDDSEKLLLCDRCDGEIHMFCSKPEITELPEGEWFCSFCQERNKFEEKVVAEKRSTVPAECSASTQDEDSVDAHGDSMDKTCEKRGDEQSLALKSSLQNNNLKLLTETDKLTSAPNILCGPVEGDKKFNRNTAKKRQSTNSVVAKQPTVTQSRNSNVKNRATFFLVKWVGSSIRYSTWERPEDIGDDEQIQRYFKFSRLPTVREIQESSCQLPCCARRNQLLMNRVASTRCCPKDRFCTRGVGHDGECSREVATIDKAYGTSAFRHLRMVEQVKAQLFAFHCLLNNHPPDKDVLKQCGVYTNAFVCKKQYMHSALKAQQEDGDEDYSEAESDSSEDDFEDEVEEGTFQLRGRPAMTRFFPGMLGDDDGDADEQGATEDVSAKKAEDEVSAVVSSLVEHIALGYPTAPLERVVPRITYQNASFAVTSFKDVANFTEFGVALRRTALGLGMRLGVGEDGNVSVLGFQPLTGGMLGPAEACQVIAPGDALVAVNNVPVAGLAFKNVIGLISQSTNFVLFHFHSARPAYLYPPFSQAKHVTMHKEVPQENAAPASEFVPFSYHSFKSLLKVGGKRSDDNTAGDTSAGVRLRAIGSSSDHVADYITPSGPMQHLYAGIVDNSIDPHEHFSSFIPTKRLPGASVNEKTDASDQSEKNEFIPYEHSPTFKGGRTLRPYQVEGLNWMITSWKAQRSCILADEMGLGKTVQVVSFIDHLRNEETIRGPYLVVVPLSTIQHWRREIESWTDLNVCVYHDIGDHRGGKFTAKDMRAVIRNQEWYYPGLAGSVFKFNILLTTFETILSDFEDFEPIHWRLVVVDEAHRLKSVGSRVLKQMRSLNCDRKLLLTGTPLQNNTQELWVLLNYLEPVKFSSMDEFNALFGKLHSQEQVLQLQKLLGPYILRRVKEDVEKSIPPKEETIISVELTTLQKQYYRAIYDKNKSFLYRGTKNSMPTLNNIQLQLRKCCNHPFLIKGVEERELDELGDRPDPSVVMRKTVECSGKMVLVSKLLPKLKREGHKVLIFSQFLKQLDLLERYCESNGFGFERLDGTTNGSIRQNAIDRFSRPTSKTFVFLLSTKAGGVGINLIAADTVIIYDSDWNPQNDLQAQARCHRIGQKKSVQIYRLVTRNTYESEMFDRASQKLGLEHAVLGTASFSETSAIEKPSAEQLVELLKRGAYALMQEDDTASKQFAERDIETILKENARVRVVANATTVKEDSDDGASSLPSSTARDRIRKRKSLGGIAFDRSSFVADGSSNDLSVDDPNFWEKVLPGAMSVEMLIVKLEDGSALASRQAKIKFISNLDISLTTLVQELRQTSTLNEDSTSRSSSNGSTAANLQHEYDVAIQVLHMITTKHRKDFSSEQVDLVKGYLYKLEKSRVRSCRVLPGQKRGRTTGGKKLGGKHVNGNGTNDDNGEMVDLSSDSDDDDDTNDNGRRGRKKKNGSKSKVASNVLKSGPPSKKRKTITAFESAPDLFAGGVINDSDDLCTLCGDGGLILLCDGPCHRSFHLSCIGMDAEPDDEHWLCPDCSSGRHMCLICKQVGEMGVEFGVIQCSVAKCGRFYHKGCLTKHARVEWVGKKRFRCPSHFCHGCPQKKQLEDAAASAAAVAAAKARKKKIPAGSKLLCEAVVSCIHCAQSFHAGCMKASEQFVRLSTNLMICATHLRPKKPSRNDAPNTKAATRHEATPHASPKRKTTSNDKKVSESNGALPRSTLREKNHERESSVAIHKVSPVPVIKVCGLCRRSEGDDDGGPVSASLAKRGGRRVSVSGAKASPVSIEGAFLDIPVRLQYQDKSTENVYVHMNCALHSPEVYVKSDGTFCNLTRAIKRGRQLKCTSCKQVGATVGCVVEKCRGNFHLRCAVSSGGEFIGSPYSLYCKTHAEEKHKEPTAYCTCGSTDAADRTLSLACGSCSMKYHPRCVNMSERQAGRKTKDKSWICEVCANTALAAVVATTSTSSGMKKTVPSQNKVGHTKSASKDSKSHKSKGVQNPVAEVPILLSASDDDEDADVANDDARATRSRKRSDPAHSRSRSKKKGSSDAGNRRAASSPSRKRATATRTPPPSSKRSSKRARKGKTQPPVSTISPHMDPTDSSISDDE